MLDNMSGYIDLCQVPMQTEHKQGINMKQTFIVYLIIGIVSLIYGSSSYAACSGTCRWCGQYSVPCSSWSCMVGGTTNSDVVKSLPTGSIKNSSISDTDGCADNYPSVQTKLPFTVEGTTYTQLPTNVRYTINVCYCP